MTTATIAKTEKELSMSPSAVRARARRATANALKESHIPVEVIKVAKTIVPKTRKQATAAPIKINAAQKRTIGQFMASIAAGFLPIASFVMAHYESKENQMLWILVAAALAFSAPTLVLWAKKWCGGMVKAVGFSVLLEGTMVFSHTVWLSYAGLFILVAINASNAYSLAARKEIN